MLTSLVTRRDVVKQGIPPAVAAIVIILVVAVVGYFIWQGVGPRTDGAKEPINMGKLMGKDKLAPPTRRGPMSGGPIGGGASQ